MKRIFAIALVAVMLLGCFSGCSANKGEVSVLWQGAEAAATNPNSLINAMDRAMYISNLSYKHYAAGGDQATQTKQAETALNAGCVALVVELVDSAAAQKIVDLAKAKNVPVVFFGCEVDDAVVNSYEKCALVAADEDRLSEGYSAMLYKFFGPVMEAQKKAKEKNKEKDGYDKDGDGKITYLALTDIAISVPSSDVYKDYGLDAKLYVDFAFVPVKGTLEDLQLKIVTKEKKGLFGTSTEEYAQLVTADGKIVEAIFAGDDKETLNTLVALQKLGLNADKLTTHFIPVMTVGADADYKAYVMENIPTDAAARAEYLESFKLLVDMTGIEKKQWTKWEAKEENEIDNMVYNTLNQISAGKISGSAVEDYDAIAIATAELVASLLKGEPIEANIVKLPYAVSISG